MSWLHEQVSLAKLQNRGQTLCYSLNSLNTIQYQTLNICSSWTYPLSNVLSGIRVREINNNYFDFNKSDQVLWQGIADRESLWWRISDKESLPLHLKSYTFHWNHSNESGALDLIAFRCNRKTLSVSMW